MNRLTLSEAEHFDREGFILVRQLLDFQTDLQPVMTEYAGVLDRLAHVMFDACEIKSLYDDLSFSDRMIACYRDSGKVLSQHFDCSLPQTGTRADSPIWVGAEVF